MTPFGFIPSVPVAQLEERQFPKLEVTGSIPVGCASQFKSGKFFNKLFINTISLVMNPTLICQ